jgi:hypothetical protein
MPTTLQGPDNTIIRTGPATEFWAEPVGTQALNRIDAPTTTVAEFDTHTTYSFTTPIKSEDIYPEPYYDSFAFGFYGGDIDNVKVTGVPYEPPATEFQGF